MPRSATPLVFLHIPKTGGTTLSSVIGRNTSGRTCFAIRGADIAGGVDRLRQLPAPQAAAIGLLKGHQAFGLHCHLAPGARYLAMLRHPVGRVASHYNYLLSHPQHPMHGPLRERGYSLAQYATSGLFPDLDNGQTRLLAGVWDARPLQEADLERAIQHIDQHFAWVGLMERFDESLIELGFALGWWRLGYRKRNVSERASAELIDSRARDAILAANPLDLRLYQHVVRRFDRVSPWQAWSRRQLAVGLGHFNALGARIGAASPAGAPSASKSPA